MGRGQMVGGAAMLGGSVLGGVIAQATNLGVPFLMRVGVLLAMFFVAARLMRGPRLHAGAVGAPAAARCEALRRVGRLRPEEPPGALGDARRRRSRRASASTPSMPCSRTCSGCGATRRRTASPGSRRRSSPARRSSAATSRRVFRRLFRKRTTALILATLSTVAILAALGLTHDFWVALVLLTVWAMVFAAEMPIRQAYLNDMIPSRQRATVLSFDSLMGIERRRRHPARARQGRRRLQLLDVARRRRGDPARGRAVPLPEPARARARGHGDDAGRPAGRPLGPAAT